MNKKIFFAVVAIFLILVGCGNQNKYAAQKNEQYTEEQQNEESTTDQQNNQCTITTSDTIDYSQYTKKVWSVKDGTDNSSYNFTSFCISEITNGKIVGKFSPIGIGVPNYYYYNFPDRYGVLTGTIDNGIAECQFSYEKGNKGSIKLVFKGDDEIEASIKYDEKSPDNKYSQEGTFQFRPFNISEYKNDINIIEDKSFTVDLNSWGNVRFVSTKAKGGDKHPTDFYLTDEVGDILYDFDFNIYNIDVNDVSFQDVNNDGLKDIIIIIGESYCDPPGSGKPLLADVFFQKTDGSFDSDRKVYKELNDSGNYKDVKAVTDYLSKKF